MNNDISVNTMAYVTVAGLEEEARAKVEKRPLIISHIAVGRGLLSNDANPKDQVDLIDEIARFPAITNKGKDSGEFLAQCDQGTPEVGYRYYEVATITDTGVVYSYNRAIGDYVPGKDEDLTKGSRLRVYFRVNHEDNVHINIEQSPFAVLEPDFNEHVITFNSFVELSNREFERKDNMALDYDIDNKSHNPKHVKLAQLWRAFFNLKQEHDPLPQYWHNDETASRAEAIAGTSHSRIMTAVRSMEQLKSRISNTHLGIRTDYAASESVARTIWLRADAAYNLAASKMTQALADARYVLKVNVSSSITSTSTTTVANSKAVGDVNRSLESLKQSDNPFPNYWHNDETASQAEAIAGTSHSRIMTALRSMEQLKSRISNAHLGIRTDYAASESVARTIWLRADAAYGHAVSKMTQAEADSRYLGKKAKAADSDKLDGLNSTDFSRSNHTHPPQANEVYKGTDPNNLHYPIGWPVIAWCDVAVGMINKNTTMYLSSNWNVYPLFASGMTASAKGKAISGTWKCISYATGYSGVSAALFVRVA